MTTAQRPVVGLSTYREPATWGVWHDVAADLLPAAYARSIDVAGGVPLLLPPVEPYAGSAAIAVRRIDALVISGGADVDPRRYDESPGPHTQGWRPDRDGWELALLDAAAEIDLPVLGICRGMQVLAVHSGGRLDQHTPDLVGHTAHSPGGDEYGKVDVHTVDGTLLHSLVGPDVTVTCHHHQSVREHPGYRPSAHAGDGCLEAIEAPDRRFWLGVQWHPETIADAGLFTGLINAAARLSDHPPDA